MFKFIRSGPPLTPTNASGKQFDFGQISSYRIRQIWLSSTINIPSDMYVSGDLYLVLILTGAGINYYTVAKATNSVPGDNDISDGTIGFLASLDVFTSGGSINLVAIPGSFVSFTNSNYAVLGVEEL